MASSSSSGSKSESFKVDEKAMASSSSSGSKSQSFNVDEKQPTRAMPSSSSSGSKSCIFKVDGKAMASSSSSSSVSKTFILKSSDGESFEVDEKVGAQCQAIKHMIEDLDGNNHVIPVSNVNAEILTKVLEYCKKHAEYPSPEDISITAKQELEEWDEDYLKMELDTLYHLILAANYLAVKGLVDLTLQSVANQIKGKKPAEIRKHFNIKNDLPPEKEEEIRKQFYWLDMD